MKKNVNFKNYSALLVCLAVVTSCIHKGKVETAVTSAPETLTTSDNTQVEIVDVSLIKREIASGNQPQILPEKGKLESEDVSYLSQNWSSSDRDAFYFTPQGSLLIPLRFARALKTQSGDKFFTSENLGKYGYIPQKKDSVLNPLGLPVGFAIDGKMGHPVIEQKKAKEKTSWLDEISNFNYVRSAEPKPVGERYVGMNCAACHTSNLVFSGKKLRIDGGQALADFQKMMTDLNTAVQLTNSDAAKLKDFVKQVAADPDVATSAEEVIESFRKYAIKRSEWQTRNGTSHVYGGGRNDAFGVIFNQVLANDLGRESNAKPTDAPVSYPFIWDAPQHDVVQWNGIADNNGPSGALGRNVGEVLGVFGEVYIDRDKQTRILKGFCSSARRAGLDILEEKVVKLWSPLWPNELSQLKSELVVNGEKIYAQKCIKCHNLLLTQTARIEKLKQPGLQKDENGKTLTPFWDWAREDERRKIRAVLENVGTDQKMNVNSLQREKAETGMLRDRPVRVVDGDQLLTATEPAAAVLKHVVSSAILGGISPITCSGSIDTPSKIVDSRWEKILGTKVGLVAKPVFATPQQNSGKDYKARPLNGVWATAPFLHNGSVRTLAQLLKPVTAARPEDARETKFFVGCENFDTVEVGFKCSEGELFDTSIYGNNNIGHSGEKYGTELPEYDKMALIEYIKSL